MRQLTTVIAITLSIFLVTKMSFSQAIKVNSSGNVGINGGPGNGALKVDGDMGVTGDIVGYGDDPYYGYMTLSNSYQAVDIISGSNSYDALFTDGNIFVNGDGTSTIGWYVSSDRRLKKNLQYLNGSKILNQIQTISGRKYQFKDREELIQMHENNQIQFSVDTIDLETEIENLEDEYGSVSDSMLQHKLGYERTIMLDGKQYGLRIFAPDYSRKKHYGLIAQEIENEFPELVKYDSTRMQYVVNYDGFVPVLLEALKAQQNIIDTNRNQLAKGQNQMSQQQQRITDLEQLVQQQQSAITSLQAQVDTILSQCCSGTVENKSNPTGTLKVNEDPKAELYQNIPNPFTESTRIKYFLPESTDDARIYIYNMQGSQVNNFQINAFGEGNITIQAGSMQPGMYMYTLVADDQVVDTKRMILTK